MSKRNRTPIHYDFWSEAKCITGVAPVEVSRDSVPQICEGLHSFVGTKRGACFYYPSIPGRMTICRYEWPRRWGKNPVGLRLGFVLLVDDGDLKEIPFYITSNEAVENPQIGPPKISARLLRTLQQEVVDALSRVFDSTVKRDVPSGYQVFYIEMPSSIDLRVEIGPEIVVFPTRVVRKTQKWISAVAVKIEAQTNEGAKLKALHEIMLLCALASLVGGEVYKTTQVPFRRNLPRLKTLDSVERADLNRLYPIGTRAAGTIKADALWGEKVRYVWDAYHKLSKDHRNRITPALFAYYAGVDIIGKQPTLAVVSFVAALSSLASEGKQKCLGHLTCSVCGSLDNFSHDKIGDRAAVTSLLYDLLQIEEHKDKVELRNLIKRIYSEQRSGYVHGATLRYEEYHKKSDLPAAFPTATEPVRPLYFYKRDLGVIHRITRRALCEWIARHSGVSPNRDLLGLKKIKIEDVRSMEAVLTLPAGRWVHLMQGSGERAAESE